jgi:EmrB/QacA subfamily drug resistance transporter
MADVDTPPTGGSELHAPHDVTGRWAALVVVCLAQFMVVLDATVTNVALPSIQEDLKFSPEQLQWVVNSYTLAFGGLLLLGGRCSDLLGRRRVFVLGTVLFSIASLLNGLAWNPESLIVFRGLQGVGAALISPAALSVIMTSFAEGPERSKALSVWSGIAASGAAVGLLLGGILTELLSWPWIFFVNVPVGIAVIAAAYKWVPESRAELGHRRFDVFGAITVTAGLMLLVYAIVGTVEHGFTSTRTLALTGISIALLVAFAFIESVSKAPLVRLGLFKVRSLAVANTSMLVVAAGMFSFFFFSTLYMQQVLGYGPIKAGAAFVPFTIGIGIGAGAAQAFVRRIGVRAVGTIGMLLAAGGLVYLANDIAIDGTYMGVFIGIIPMSIGMGMTFVPLTLVATTNVAQEEAGLASGVFNTSQQIGGALGLAILSTVASNRSEDAAKEAMAAIKDPTDQALQLAAQMGAMVEGFSTAFYWGAGFMIAGLVVYVLFLRKKDVENIDVTAPITMA